MCVQRQADQDVVQDLHRYIKGWDWLGPGVWLGLDLTAFVFGQRGAESVVGGSARSCR